MRRKGLLISLVLLTVALTAGVIAYYQPVRVEDLNRMRGCLCGPCEVKFKDGTITLLASPHPEEKPVGTVIGRYRMEGGTLLISASGRVVEHMLDHRGAHWKPGPGEENSWGPDFYDNGSWKFILHGATSYGWRKTNQFFTHDLRRDPVWWVIIAAVIGFGWWRYRKRRAKRKQKLVTG